MSVAPQETSRTCPYCRFPLKDGVPALRCDLCQAVHHEDCWRDGGGCATYGCPNGPGKDPPPPDPATRVQAPPPNAFPWKVTLLTFLAVIVIAGAGTAAWILTHRGHDKVAAKPTPTATASAAPSPVAQRNVALDIEKIVTFSRIGRTAAQQGRYDAAIANRKEVLKRLGAVKGASGHVASAKSTLEQAMNASLQADQALAAHRSAAKFNAQATALKEQFVKRWAPVASSLKLHRYSAGEI